MEKYNTFGRRFWAGFVDGLVLLPIDIMDRFLLNSPNLSIVITWMIFSYSSYYLYSVIMHGLYGQTLGKIATGVIVIDNSEEKRINFKQAILRDSVYIIFNISLLIASIIKILKIGEYSELELSQITLYLGIASLIWFLVEVISMLTNKRRRAVHDLIANTVVIQKEYNETKRN